MAHAQVARGDLLLYLAGEAEDAQKVRDRGAFLAHPLGEVLLGELEFVLEPLVRLGCFERVQVLALDVLDERHLQELALGRFLHDGRNGLEPGEPCRAPPALACDQAVAAACSVHDDGLDDPLLFYGRCELFELPVVKDLPRLVLVGSDPVQLDLDDAERSFLFVVGWRGPG